MSQSDMNLNSDNIREPKDGEKQYSLAEIPAILPWNPEMESSIFGVPAVVTQRHFNMSTAFAKEMVEYEAKCESCGWVLKEIEKNRLADEALDENWENKDEVGTGIPKLKPGVTTWWERNSDRPMIPLRSGCRKQDADTRATAATKKVDMAFQDNINWINPEHNKLVDEVAKKHNVKVDVVLRRLMPKSSFKASRTVNVFNAKVHHLAKRLKRMGEKTSLDEMKRCAEEAALTTELLQNRTMKEKGARATNAAAAADVCFTI
ncbi:hypothetical protein B0H17DRAFT_1136542 [Mycena rosella]|uniref:Uncharacterized protein n=1 Tax=Mycena rosella TaxID=1033263 RepID=A0AAD7DAL8_MYCRO|nr:hypothetical protein B0H17DRAFT_1136542 [Mycena rosella]